MIPTYLYRVSKTQTSDRGRERERRVRRVAV
jgi:hypothetical protein